VYGNSRNDVQHKQQELVYEVVGATSEVGMKRICSRKSRDRGEGTDPPAPGQARVEARHNVPYSSVLVRKDLSIVRL
jgi:hypothetical protein